MKQRRRLIADRTTPGGLTDVQRGRLCELRSKAIVRRVQELLPGASDTQFWTGLRPATPSTVPQIGHSRVKGLFINTGHGTLGWTHACGSGKSIVPIVSRMRPELEFAFQQEG